MGTLDPRLECFLQVPNEKLVPRAFWSLNVPETVAQARTRVFVRLASGGSVQALANQPGVLVRSVLGNLVTAEASAAGLHALRSSPAVLYVEAARPLMPTQFEARGHAKTEIPSGPLAETGQNVIVGVVDWGCDFTHDDFRSGTGSTRLLALWDQSAIPKGGRRAPNGYSTGVEFDSTAINEALKAADPFAALGVAPPGLTAHGTHVLGIAAGNGRTAPAQNVRGMAPEADIIFVQPETGDVEITGGFGDSVHLAEAVQYIFSKASALRRPAVVNLSMGTNSGPHDGTTLVEQWIDNLLATPGRAVVLALGNEHHERFNRTHSEGKLSTGERQTLYWRVLANDRSPNEMEIWYSGRDLFEAEIELPNGSRLPVAPPGTNRIDTISGSRLRVFQGNTLHSPLNGDNQINVIVLPEVGTAVDPGVWQVHLKALRARDGTFDAWIERDSMQGGARMSSFLGGSYVRRKTLGSIQSARLAITVSNYDAVTTTLSDSTSFGPTRDGRHAPTVAAPGVDILAAKSMWRTDLVDRQPYVALTGTSMSAPYVTGVVACMLQKNPRLTAAQIRGILAAQAKPAPGFSDDWSIDWGNGRVDPIDTLAATPTYAPDVEPPVALFTAPIGLADTLCEATHSHVEGPFYRPGAPETLDLYPKDSRGPILYFEGFVRNETCEPLSNTRVEIWQADDLGHYDNDDPSRPPAPDAYRCRGQLVADSEGRFSLRTVLPANYKVDPTGDWTRVKHLHFKLFAAGHAPLTTEIALLPDEFTAVDQLYDPALSAQLKESAVEDGRIAWRAEFHFVLQAASTMGYAFTVRLSHVSGTY